MFYDAVAKGKKMQTFLKIMAAALTVVMIALAGVVIDANLQITREETLAADSGAPGRFVTVDRHKLHVATIGDIAADPSGAPLLLIHGFAAPGHVTWLPWASKLSAQRALILPDLFGFGHSARVTAPDQAYSLHAQAAALAAMLDDLGVAHVDVVGESYGGTVAARFALDYPTRVRRIVFMDAAIYPHSDGFGSNLLMRLSDLPLGIGRAVVWHTLAGGPFGFVAQNCRDQPNCRWMRLAHVAGTTDSLRAMLSARQHFADDAALPGEITNIKAPSLVVWGGSDRVVPVTDGDRLARELKSNFAVIADADHLPFIRQPDKVARRVLDYFQPQ
jgi:pimeloyl-ACP methyl ester carboxylesterase